MKFFQTDVIERLLGRFSIKFKLVITFVFVLTLTTSYSYVTKNSVTALKQIVIQLYDEVLMSGSYALSAKYRYAKFDSDVRNAILAIKKEDYTTAASNITEDLTSFNEDLDVVKQRAFVPEYKDIVTNIQAQIPSIEKKKNDLLAELADSYKKGPITDFTKNLKVLRKWEADDQRLKISDSLTELSDKATAAGYEFRNASVDKSTLIEKAALISGILIFFFIAISALLLLASLLQPLKKITNACIDIAAGNFDIQVDVRTHDEFHTLAKAFNIMIAAINEKSALLKEEIKTVSNLLNNMQQAVFAVDKKGTIVAPASKYTETLLGTSPVGKSVFSTLYKSIPRDSETFAGINSAMVAAYDGNEFQWELVNHLFPVKVKYNSDQNGTEPSIFKVACTALYNSSEEVEKILFIVEDITQLEKLEAGVKEARAAAMKNLDIIQELSQLSPDEANRFFSSCQRLLIELGSIKTSASFDDAKAAALMRDLHTLKGNARLLNFSHISGTVHEIEGRISNSIQNWKKGLGVSLEDVIAEIIKIDNAITEEIIEYAKFSKMILGVTNEFVDSSDTGNQKKDSSHSQMIQIQETRFKEGLKKCEELEKRASTLTKAEIQQLIWFYRSLTHIPIHSLFSKMATMAKELSTKFNKKVDVVFKGEETAVAPNQLNLIQDCLVHLVRNAMDHGIETADERKATQKPETSKIELSCESNEGRIIIRVTDDGRGINGVKLAQKAVEKGKISQDQAAKMSEDEKINLVFLPSFSSRDEVTDISGRGVGMDAVKSMIESNGGQITLKSQLGKGTQITFNI